MLFKNNNKFNFRRFISQSNLSFRKFVSYVNSLIKKIYNFFSALPRQTKLIVLIIIALTFCLVIGGLIWQLWGRGWSEERVEMKNKADEENLLFKSDIVATAGIGQTAKLGSLEITFYNAKESSYQSLDLDVNHQRITKNYLAAQIKVFNPTNDRTENLLIGLTDERGNNYRLDPSVLSYTSDLKDFGQNMSIYPRIIQEGYVSFSGIDKDAKEMQLIFAGSSAKTRVVFKFER